MKGNKGITLVPLTISLVVLLLLASVIISLFKYSGDLAKERNTTNTVNTVQENCEHDWVIKSEYNWILKSYKTYSVCSKCGKEIR